MGLPPLTPAQRAEALAKSTEVRQLRAEIKQALRDGRREVDAVIEEGKDDPRVGKMPVKDLLQAMPGVGRVKAERIMDEIGIASSRRVRGLGKHQADALRERFRRK